MRQLVGTVLLTMATAAATLAFLQMLGPDWTLFPPATCMVAHCFCEIPHTDSLLLQPANTWSSLGFVLVGFWIMLAPWRRETVFAGWPALWFGLTAVVIGVGSFLLHATLTLWGQFYDVLGMYLLSGFLLAYAVHRWRGLSTLAALALYLVVCALLIALLWAMPETRRWLFAAVLGLALAVELILARPLRPNVRVSLLLYGLTANTIAFGIWILDNTRTLCMPDSLLQGHAVWHLLGAIAIYFTYRYYCSEHPKALR
jgi:hypothetical protein